MSHLERAKWVLRTLFACLLCELPLLERTVWRAIFWERTSNCSTKTGLSENSEDPSWNGLRDSNENPDSIESELVRIDKINRWY